MSSDELRQRRLAVVEEHMSTEVTKEFDRTLATFNGGNGATPHAGLIADASTRIVYHQDESQIELTRTLLGLSRSESELLTMLSAGQALWRVGSRSFVVQHYRSRLETRLTDTDAGMSVIGQRPGRR